MMGSAAKAKLLIEAPVNGAVTIGRQVVTVEAAEW